ncbi:hypothetical protein AF332_11715 [Sporosarcina globispora]|uniref:Uncharacterized protein n=1 Tax=Sporosarcina globispora TaxID=1459 RepID=A0A0M0GD17_SPOGL|nr:hypothetical protein [Sporosarcina globispora]KON87427.1 hypothetical protein AF332_11715 [Sporosarcina globispora]
MRKLFKEDEFDRINAELVNSIIPAESLNGYFNLGVAQTLSTLTDIANQYINGQYSKELDAVDLKKIIVELMCQNKEARTYFDRLRNDGIKLNHEDFS